MLDVFYIGDPGDEHFRETIAWLRANVALDVVAGIDAAVRRIDEGACPAVVLLGQSRRGQFAASDVVRLLRAAHLAQVVVLLGSWCEGEARSGTPIPGVHRVYWHAARQVIPRELAMLAAGRASGWSWPATAIPSASVVRMSNRRALAVVVSGSAVMAAGVSVALREVGWKTVVMLADRPNIVLGADAIIWDVPADAKRANAEWGTLQDGFAGLPVVAMCGFPRPEDAGRLRSMGVDAVVGKPFQVADLVAAVQRVVAENRGLAQQTVAAA